MKQRETDMTEGPPARRNAGEHTKARLLDVAREVAARVPYPDITVEHLTEPARISRATFYLYFRNKTDIYLALTSECVERLSATAGGWRDGDDPRKAIDEAVLRYLEAFVEELGPMRLLYTVAPTDERFDAILRKFSRRFTDCIERHIREGQAHGHYRAELDAAATTEALWAMLEGFCHRHLLPAPGISFSGPRLVESAKVLADLSYHGIAADA
jgi:AcrR family transcriptional regulator